MSYSDFNDLLLSGRKCLKFNRLDIEKLDLTNKHHKNLYDPQLGVLIEENCLVNSHFFIKTKDEIILRDVGYREKIPNNSDFDEESNYINSFDDEVFLLGGDTNYYHWLLNWIPRLFLYELANLNCPILVNKNFNKMQLNVLEKLFPWSIDRLVKIQGLTKFKKIFVPNFFLNPIHSPFAIRNIRSRLFSLYYNEIYNPKFCQNILISRCKANTRKIVNESEFLEQLKYFGFEKIILEDLDFLDQVNLFFHAKRIISPHGAGLTNLLFSNHKPRVVEIINEHYTTVFWSLGYICGADSYDIYKSNVIDSSHGVRIHKDMNIDISKFLSDQFRIFG